MRQVMLAITPEFERRTGNRLSTSFDSGGLLEQRLARGDRFDVLIAPRPVIERLAAAGEISENGVFDIAASRVGVAVRGDAPSPDISSVAAFRQAMLSARAIACPDPQMGGSSGVHIARVFERLGISELVKSKLVLASTPSIAGTLPGDLVASGRADVALHQIQELRAVPGIRLVGPFPTELQARFIFTCGIPKSLENEAGARDLLHFLRSPHAASIIRRTGMEAILP
jgi:molybdate transport system substrate-binding protein